MSALLQTAVILFSLPYLKKDLKEEEVNKFDDILLYLKILKRLKKRAFTSFFVFGSLYLMNVT